MAMKGIATRVWTVAIPVSSFDKALSFYRDLLGLKVQLDGRMFNWMELGPDEPHAKIGIYEYKDDIGSRKPGVPTGLNFDTDDIHELHKRLSAKGVKFLTPPTKQPWGGVLTDLADFDGNSFQITQDPEHYERAKTMAAQTR